MRQTIIILTILVTAITLLVTGCTCCQPQSMGTYSWKDTDTSIALLNNGKTVWQLNYDRRIDKPYFHPVSLVDGTVLTELMPADHIWHRGLWWSWKTINGVNYWEEDKDTLLAEGRNEIIKVAAIPGPDYSADVEIHISYHPPGEPAVIMETRTLKMSPPDEKGMYTIDWKSTFTARDKDVLLDRTPIPGEENGVAWGGYAGLSVRLADSAVKWQAVDSEAHTFDNEFNNAKAKWLDYCIETESGGPAGIAILDHPSNLRYPTPWYVILGEGMRYFSPAFLYYEPYTIKAGRSLTLRYRIVVHPGGTDARVLERQWEEFSKSKW